MHGPDTRASTALTSGSLPTRGVVPRAVLEILDCLDHFRRTDAVVWTLHMSYVEVFGNDVTDLLASDGPEHRQAVGAWAGVAARAVLEGRCAVAVDSRGMWGCHSLHICATHTCTCLKVVRADVLKLVGLAGCQMLCFCCNNLPGCGR